MKKIGLIAGALAALVVAGSAHAATLLADPPGFYSGSGGANNNWTIVTNNNVELGLRAIHRQDPAPIPRTGSTYFAQTGYQDPNPMHLRTWWNFEYSVNLRVGGPMTGTLTNADITPLITVVNGRNGQSITFNPFVPITGTPDNAGWNGSMVTHEDTDPAGFAASYGFQNSEELIFGFVTANNPLFGYDPNENNTFYITLAVFGPGNINLGSVSETIVVGSGVPLPAALPLFVSGLGLMGFAAARRKRKLAAT